MNADVYLLRERKEADLDAPAVPKGVALTEKKAKEWCRNCPEEVSARIFEPLPLIGSDEGDSPVSATAESYVVAEVEEDKGNGRRVPIYQPLRFVRINDQVVELQFRFTEYVGGEHFEEWRGLTRLNRNSLDASRYEQRFGIDLATT